MVRLSAATFLGADSKACHIEQSPKGVVEISIKYQYVKKISPLALLGRDDNVVAFESVSFTSAVATRREDRMRLGKSKINFVSALGFHYLCEILV